MRGRRVATASGIVETAARNLDGKPCSPHHPMMQPTRVWQPSRRQGKARPGPPTGQTHGSGRIDYRGVKRKHYTTPTSAGRSKLPAGSRRPPPRLLISLPRHPRNGSSRGTVAIRALAHQPPRTRRPDPRTSLRFDHFGSARVRVTKNG